MLIEMLLEYINKHISQILIVQETFKHLRPLLTIGLNKDLNGL